jgi:hypothetical protein
MEIYVSDQEQGKRMTNDQFSEIIVGYNYSVSL